MNEDRAGSLPQGSASVGRVFRQGLSDTCVNETLECKVAIAETVASQAARRATAPYHDWKVVGLYLTQSGKVGIKIERKDNGCGAYSFRYGGEWGAGCGPFASVASGVKLALRSHKRHRAEIPWASLALSTSSEAQ